MVRDGQLVHARGCGLANPEHGIPTGPATDFDIGSTSKQITGPASHFWPGKGSSRWRGAEDRPMALAGSDELAAGSLRLRFQRDTTGTATGFVPDAAGTRNLRFRRLP